MIRVSTAALVGAALAAWGGPALAQDVTLKVMHFLPPTAIAQTEFIEPWAERLREQSGGRIEVEIYPAMQLGGRPAQLIDQVRDGVVDVVWTLPGFTADRFPITEVFELPFMTPLTAEASSQAAQAFFDQHLAEEYADYKILAMWTHAPGGFHMRETPVRTLEDLEGLEIRAPTRTVSSTIEALGATPVAIPTPQVPDSLSKGVVDGVSLPFEPMPALRVDEMTRYHTEIVADGRGFYTAVFVFAMNKEVYDGLPEDLRVIIDANSGMALAAELGRVWDEAETAGRDSAASKGGEFIVVEGEEAARWKAATQPVVDAWVAAMTDQGHDGPALLKSAQDLIVQYSE